LTQGENVNPCPWKKTKKRKFPIKESEESKKRKFPIKEWEKAKKKENSRSRIGRKQKKYAKRSLDQTISGQYIIVTK